MVLGASKVKSSTIVIWPSFAFWERAERRARFLSFLLSLKLVELAGRAGNLAALFRLVGTLTLVGQVLLNVEIDSVFVNVDGEHLVVEESLAAGILSFYVVDCEFH